MSAAGLTVRRIEGDLWAVFQGGRQVSGRQTRERAEARADRMAHQARERMRPCITCRRPFRSEGPHNRMCNLCRTRRTGGTDMSVVGDVAGRFR